MTARVSPTRAALALLACVSAAGAAWAQAPTGPGSGVSGRLENVRRLIEESSGAKQVEGSGAARAVAAREEARQLFRQASRAHEGGDDTAAAGLLNKATRAMFDAVRLAGKPASINRKHERDFDAREESVSALLGALERVGKEKRAEDTTGKAADRVRKLMGEAKSQRDAGNLDQGRATMDAAYEEAKRAIEAQRGGDTLVRSLNFATKEEEYHYEVDRNDTHRMLIDVLAKEKRASAGIDRMVTTFTDRALRLRTEAEGQAKGGDFAGAIDTLERSTKEYIRAIRSTGIYIPG